MILLVPVILIIHNTEEYLAYEAFIKEFKLPERFRHRKILLYSLIILTLIASAICLANYFVQSAFWQFATTIVVLALLLNGLQHCLLSLWRRRVVPGTVSAAVLMVPFSVIYLSSQSVGVVDLAAALLFMFVSINLSLRAGYFLTHNNPF